MMTTNDHSIEKWIKYRDIQREISDEEYQQDKKEAIINKYRIDLINLIEIRIDNYEKQRPIEGTRLFYERRCLRKNRFSSKCAVVLMDSTNCPSYGRFDSWCPFLKAWFETSKGKRSWLQLSSCIEACAQGIVAEAGKHNMIDEATSMAQQLRLCSTSSRKQATELCMRFYTQDTFLYDELNKALRQCDLSKLSTLAPIAFLISNYSHSGHEFVGTVYRGVNFTSSDIQEYKQAIGTWKTWPAYTSTSKNRQLAEMYGPTLLIIQITDIKLSAPRSFDISPLSHYPVEEEVLLPAGTSFKILDVQLINELKSIISIQI